MKHKCPSCETELVWSKDNEFRPFCSAQCKNKDFIDWANEDRVIAGNSMFDDILSGDLEVVDFKPQ